MTGFHKNKHNICTANLSQLKYSLGDTGTHNTCVHMVEVSQENRLEDRNPLKTMKTLRSPQGHRQGSVGRGKTLKA